FTKLKRRAAHPGGRDPPHRCLLFGPAQIRASPARPRQAAISLPPVGVGLQGDDRAEQAADVVAGGTGEHGAAGADLGKATRVSGRRDAGSRGIELGAGAARPGDTLSGARRYADERSAEGAGLVGLGRRPGRPLVENTPDWPTMGPAEVES
ncbi:hypothetical protein ACWCQ6_33130, partial [Streptomyces sp. NPDC001880]